MSIVGREISLFKEVKLVNSINVFRGESEKAGFSFLGRLIENKFTYFGRHVLFNSLIAVSPLYVFYSTISFILAFLSAPDFLGFLIPSLYFLIAAVNKKKPDFGLLFIVFPLLIPAVLHSYFPDMGRLIVFSLFCYLLYSTG